MLSFLSNADTEGDDNANSRTEIVAEAALVIGNCASEFDEMLLSTWRTLMHNELTLTEQMEV